MPRAPAVVTPPPRRLPAATAVVTLGLAAATVLTLLAFLGKAPFAPTGPREEGTVFYAVPYHYGFAFYDAAFREIEAMEVREGDAVTLYIVPALALSEQTFADYAERTLKRPMGGLPAGDLRIREKIAGDLDLGNVEHIIGISAHPVYVTTDVARTLGDRGRRADAPPSVAEAVRRKDPTIRAVTFTTKKVGAFDVICVDSGPEGGATCGWGHQWMVAKGALVVRR